VLTVNQAAARVNVSASLIYALCASKRLRHSRIGLGRGCIRIEPVDLDEFVASQKVGGTPPKPAPLAPRQFKHVVVPN
jgi:excisionase family DNA binding protein